MKKLILVNARIVADAEKKVVNNKATVVFTVADNKKYKTKEGVEVEEHYFFSCYMPFVGNEKRIELLKKGNVCYIEGDYNTKIYQNKKGESLVSFSISVFTLQVISTSKKQGEDKKPLLKISDLIHDKDLGWVNKTTGEPVDNKTVVELMKQQNQTPPPQPKVDNNAGITANTEFEVESPKEELQTIAKEFDINEGITANSEFDNEPPADLFEPQREDFE